MKRTDKLITARLQKLGKERLHVALLRRVHRWAAKAMRQPMPSGSPSVLLRLYGCRRDLQWRREFRSNLNTDSRNDSGWRHRAVGKPR
eukprot:16434187-Heterocapsa_arctica.AAC.1